MLEIDHVIITVSDLDAAAERIRRSHGLASVLGGRHEGHGTGNRIIPLGGTYIELMAVVDEPEAMTSPLGSWVARRTADGDHPAAVCLRTDDISSIGDDLGYEPLAMSRRRPDGTEIAWLLAGMDRMIDDGSPFFIEWHIDPSDHPGAMDAPHEIGVTGIAWVEMGDAGSGLAAMPGGSAVDVRLAPGPPRGVHRVAVGTTTGEITL